MAVDGADTGDPLTLDERLRARAGDPVTLTVRRADGSNEDIALVPRAVDWLEEARWPTSPASISSLGIALGVDALVAAIVPDSPAAAAGIVAGDRVVRVRFVPPGEKAVGDEGHAAEGAADADGIAVLFKQVRLESGVPADAVSRCFSSPMNGFLEWLLSVRRERSPAARTLFGRGA